MAVQPWCEGPNFVWLSKGNGPFQFFGTAAHVPKPRITHALKPLPNDVTGHTNPFDLSWQGQTATIFLSMSRWDYGLYLSFASAASGTPGKEVFGSMGTLMLFQQKAFQVAIAFPYATIPAFTGMPGGYLFYSCVMASEDINEEGGTEGQIAGITVTAWEKYNPVDGSSALYRTLGAGELAKGY